MFLLCLNELLIELYIYIFFIFIDIGDVQIISDNRLQVYYYNNQSEGNKWIDVCHDGFNDGAAAAACRQLGFTDVQNYRLSDIQYDFFIEQITCPTVSNYALYGELHILRCHFTIPKTHACSPAFIECKKTKLQEQPYNGQVYLSEDANTPKSSGIVNIYLNSTRYVICHNDLVNEFKVHIGTSICRQLGYTSGSITPYNVQIGEFKSFLDITNFMCSHNSFPCFSHCIANSTRQECKTNQIIHIDCSFDVHFIATNSSGSKSLCELSTSDLLLSDRELMY
jgi:hypothetical protein